jgi:aminotransferase
MNVNDAGGISARLADRVRHLNVEARNTSEIATEPITVPREILEPVRDALLNGETHYTSRPGIAELRSRVAERLSRLGAPSFDAATEVIITAGEREAVFVTVLGLRLGASDVWTAGDVTRYQSLFALMGLTLRPIHSADRIRTARVAYRDRGATMAEHEQVIALAEADGITDVLNIGDAVADVASVAVPAVGKTTVVIGGLEALPGQVAFGTGFVAGPAARLAPIRSWKQAFSICTAAPSQRAALLAMASASFSDREGL